MKRMHWLSAVAILPLVALTGAMPAPRKAVNPCATGQIYVTSQNLCFDTFATRDPLPRQGRFQLLEDGVTEFGPGDPGYLGGRWWEDLNGNGVQDPDDHYFLCPLMHGGEPPAL